MKPDRSEPVLDVVAEDPQVEHVAADVEPARVHEHRGEERDDLCGEKGSRQEPRWHERPRGDERIERGVGPSDELVDEHRDVAAMNAQRDPGDAVGWGCRRGSVSRKALRRVAAGLHDGVRRATV